MAYFRTDPWGRLESLLLADADVCVDVPSDSELK